MRPVPAREVVASDDAVRARASALVAAAFFLACMATLTVPGVLRVTRTPTLGATPSVPVERSAKLEVSPTKLAGALAESPVPTSRFRGTNARVSR